MNKIKSILCYLGFHSMTKWKVEPNTPIGFGTLRRYCVWCGRQEAKN